MDKILNESSILFSTTYNRNRLLNPKTTTKGHKDKQQDKQGKKHTKETKRKLKSVWKTLGVMVLPAMQSL